MSENCIVKNYNEPSTGPGFDILIRPTQNVFHQEDPKAYLLKFNL